MKYSLKDLMWWVTFASLGLGCLVAFFGNSQRIELEIVAIFLTGPLLGAGIGKIFHRAWFGAFIGAAAFLVLALAVISFIAMLGF